MDVSEVEPRTDFGAERVPQLVGLVHRGSDRLVEAARVLADDVYLALVLDVVVCQPEMLAFYRRWGFTEEVGRSTLMRRVATPPSLRR